MADDKIGDRPEIWKPVHLEGFREFYSVSNHGRVRRDKPGRCTVVGKILANVINNTGYYQVHLSVSPNKKLFSVHILVAWVFLPPPPGPTGSKKGEYQINHKDAIKANNHVYNLEWLTNEKHHAHTKANGLLPRGEQHYKSKLTEFDIIEIRDRYKAGGISCRVLGEEFDVSGNTISAVVLRRSWAWLP